MLDLMMKLQDELGLSYIFISHDIGVIRYMCDRVAVMYRGKVVETGRTEQVCEQPAARLYAGPALGHPASRPVRSAPSQPRPLPGSGFLTGHRPAAQIIMLSMG